MEIPESNIISFIGKTLRYKTLSLDALADICIIGYSASDIVNTKNIVVQAFEENIDPSLLRTTNTNNLRGDLFWIFEYLEHCTCKIGQEREYTEYIVHRALTAQLDDMSETDDNELEQQDNPPVQLEEMPMNEDMDMQEPDEHNREENSRFPIEDIHDEPDQVGAELQALSVNSPAKTLDPEEEVRVNAPLPNQGQEGLRGSPIKVMVSTRNEDARVASLRVQLVGRRRLTAVKTPIVQQPTDQAPARSEAGVDAPAASTAEVEDNISNDLDDDDASSLSSLTSASFTSEEDFLPPTNPDSTSDSVQVDLQVQLPRPIAPPAQRFEFEGLPEPSQPILIPKPIRLVPDWESDEESPTSDLVLHCTKRPRRMDRPE